MIAGRPSLYPGDEDANASLGRSTLSRLGSGLALVYHDTLQAPLPGRWHALVADLDRAGEGDDRSDRDEVTRVRR